MATMLESLYERRDAAQKAYEDYAAPLLGETRDLTPEEETRISELRGDLDRFNARILTIEEDVQRDQLVTEVRTRIGTAGSISNVREARTYGEGSRHSFFADYVRSQHPNLFGGDVEGAVERLNKHGREVAGEMRDPNSAEGKRALRTIRSQIRGENNEAAVEATIQRAMHFGEQGLETRAGMSTSVTSGGSFVTPEYFVSQYAPYREFGRPFADAANKMPLPEYGMTIYLPAVNTGAAVSAQVGENQGITEQDPNAGYLSTGLTTEAGQVTVSQQLLDRAGPDFQFDVMVFDQLKRDYNPKIDALVLTTAIANAGSVSVSAPTDLFGSGSILSSLAKAKAQSVTASGVKLPVTHVFFQPINWEWMTVQVNSQGNPLIVPTYAGPFNAGAAAGDGTPVVDGPTGYKTLGVPVWEDGSIPASGGNNQAVAAHMPEVWYWEGDPVLRTVPQTAAQNLSVLLQLYSYVGCIVRYPQAVQVLTGLSASPTF